MNVINNCSNPKVKVFYKKKERHRHLEKMPLEKEPLTEAEVKLIHYLIPKAKYE